MIHFDTKRTGNIDVYDPYDLYTIECMSQPDAYAKQLQEHGFSVAPYPLSADDTPNTIAYILNLPYLSDVLVYSVKGKGDGEEIALTFELSYKGTGLDDNQLGQILHLLMSITAYGKVAFAEELQATLLTGVPLPQDGLDWDDI